MLGLLLFLSVSLKNVSKNLKYFLFDDNNTSEYDDFEKCFCRRFFSNFISCLSFGYRKV